MSNLVVGNPADILALKNFIRGVELDARIGTPAQTYAHHSGPSWGEVLLNQNGSLSPLLRMPAQQDVDATVSPDHPLRKLSGILGMAMAGATEEGHLIEDHDLYPDPS